MATVVLLLTACNENQPRELTALTSPPAGPVFISKDSANKMMQSYLASIAAGSPDDLHALILNADSMRSYLLDTSIRYIKVSLAHTLDYINAGNNGKPAGYESGALTIILAGVNSGSNYVLFGLNQVMNMAAPCPNLCWVTGTAASDLLP